MAKLRVYTSQIEAVQGHLEEALTWLEKLSGPDAERLALDMDHANLDHSRWYRNVKRVRKFLEGR